MKALQITAHGPVDALKPVEVPSPRLLEGQVRVQVEAAGVNPSDLLSAEGRFPHAVLPRILGRDFAGRVVEGPRELVGAAVLGDRRRPRHHPRRRPCRGDRAPFRRRLPPPRESHPEQAANAGVPFTTAWSCLVDAARLQSGETVVVSGAVGAVGGPRGSWRPTHGARVIALVKDGDEAARVDRSRVAGVARSDTGDLAEVVRGVTGAGGAQVVLNGAGAPVFSALLGTLGAGGRGAGLRRGGARVGEQGGPRPPGCQQALSDGPPIRRPPGYVAEV